MARTKRSTAPKTGYSSLFNQRLPPMIMANTDKMVIHIPILNEDTNPSNMPRKKKTTVMAQINASIPHKIQNTLSFNNRSSTTVIIYYMANSFIKEWNGGDSLEVYNLVL